MSFVKNKISALFLVSGLVLVGFMCAVPGVASAQYAYQPALPTTYDQTLTNYKGIQAAGNAAAMVDYQKTLAAGKSTTEATKNSTTITNAYNEYAEAYYNLYSKFNGSGQRIDGKSVNLGYLKSYADGGILDQILGGLGLSSASDATAANEAEYKYLLSIMENKAAQINLYESQIAASLGDTASAEYLASQGAAAAAQAQKDLETANAAANGEPIWCVKGELSSTPLEFNAVGCAALVSWSLLKFASWVLGIVAMVFNLSIDYTLNFKDFISTKANIVEVGWKTFRDMVNLFFIFILVYIGIGTIINSGTYNKNLLVKVLVTAVLLNFSLFFTQALIDASNVFTLQFYNKIIENSALVTSGGTVDSAGNAVDTNATDGITDTNSGISAAFVKSLGLDQIWTLGARSSASTGEDARASEGFTGINAMTLLLYGLGGSIFVLVTSFVLGATAYMFILRAITLIFLMILSPVAFAGGILPSTAKYVSKWWDKLWSNLLFAPAYMALMYVVLSMVFATTEAESSTSFLEIFKGGSGGASVAFTFFVLIGLMWGCLVIAMEIGAGGATAVAGLGKKWGKATAGFVADRTVGAAARTVVGGIGHDLANSDTFKAVARRLPGGGALLRGVDNMTKLKIGSKSYKDSVEAQTKKYTRTAELYENTIRRDGESEDDFKARKKENKARGDASLGVHVDDAGKVTAHTVGGLNLTTMGHGAVAAQEARIKSRSKGAEGKLEDQIKEIKEKLGHDDAGNIVTDPAERARKKASTGNSDWGGVQEERERAEGKIASIEAEIIAKEAEKALIPTTNPTAKDLSRRATIAAEMGFLLEQKKEFKAAVTTAKSLENDLKRLSVQKDQIK